MRCVGTSTTPAWQVAEGQHVSERHHLVRFASEQSPYNLLVRRIENELVPACQKHGVALLTWSTMAMGMLGGRYASGDSVPPDSRARLRGGICAERVTRRGVEVGLQFAELARAAGHEPAQLAYLWVKDQPGVTAPIIGPRKLAQLHHALPVADMQLSNELRQACDALVAPGSVVASFFNTAVWMKWKFA